MNLTEKNGTKEKNLFRNDCQTDRCGTGSFFKLFLRVFNTKLSKPNHKLYNKEREKLYQLYRKEQVLYRKHQMVHNECLQN